MMKLTSWSIGVAAESPGAGDSAGRQTKQAEQGLGSRSDRSRFPPPSRRRLLRASGFLIALVAVSGGWCGGCLAFA